MFKVSVIMPCHNAGRWVATALRSVAAQTYPSHEIIVIDDGSTDNSMAEVAATGIPVKIVRVDACNAATARNAGIGVAIGEWFALLDADDVWYPNHLARAVDLLSRSTDIAFVSNHDWIGLDELPVFVQDSMQGDMPAPAAGLTAEDFFAMLSKGLHFGHSTVVYRGDSVRKAGLFDPSQVRRHDIDLWLRVLKLGTFTYDTVKQAGYREQTPESLSKAEMECDYYYLRALSRNLAALDSPQMRCHLGKHSRRALGVAFIAGSAADFVRIKEYAMPHLPWALRLAYCICDLCPVAMRTVIIAKRKLLARQQRSIDTCEGKATA